MILDFILFMMPILFSCYLFYEIFLLAHKVKYLQLDLESHEEFTRKHILIHDRAIEKLRNSVHKKMPIDDIEYPIHTKTAQNIKDETERMSKK